MSSYSSNSDEDSSDSNEDELLNCVVIDNGSDCIKAGLDRDQNTHSVFPSVLCHAPRFRAPSVATQTMDPLVGNNAMSKKHSYLDILALKNPIVRGIVESWDDMEQIWKHTFKNELEVDPEDFSVLLTETSMDPKSRRLTRKHTTEIMFARFEVPALYLANTAALSLYASGRATGLVIDVGAGVTQVVPVYEGYPLQHAIEKLDVSGGDLTKHLVHLLRKRYKAECPDWLRSEAACTIRSSQHETVRAIKEKMALVAEDYDAVLKSSVDSFEEEYKLPDGKRITIGGAERFGCAEPLFQPSLINEEKESISSDRPGIDQLAFTSITRCDVDIRRTLYENVVLCGGTTMLPNLNVRLTQELAARAPANIRVTVAAPPDRKHSAFIGGCLLSSLSSEEGIFKDMCISKKEYYEYGESIADRKCF